MKKIPFKVEGYSAEELFDFLSTIETDKNIKFEINKHEDDERTSIGDIINLIIDNKDLVVSMAAIFSWVWKKFVDYQKIKLERDKLKLERDKFEFEEKYNEKKLELEKLRIDNEREYNLAKLELEREKLEFEKEYDKKKSELEKLEKEPDKKPQTAIIQLNYGEDIFWPLNFKSEEDFKNYLKQNSVNINTENIKSIHLK